jgi:hypothetical protein
VSGLAQMLNAYRVSQALFVAAELRVAEALADGPRAADDLAAATGADPDALYRLLRALAREGVFEETDGRTFALTELGRGLQGEPGKQARFLGRPHQWNAWSELAHSIRTGQPAFERVFGESPWSWRAARPEESAPFDQWMTALTTATNDAIVSSYDFTPFGRVVDIGGGQGALLRAILDASPQTQGTLFDQEHVVAGAPSHERLTVAAGSFFESVPRGGDAYVLKSIVHDWPDAEATAILRTVAAALDGDARVVLLERDLEDDATAWLDLQMLVMFAARERTADEYAALFAAAGLEPLGTTPVGAGIAAFEARLRR